MRLLDRYLLRELLIPLGYCLCGFLIFWTAFDLFAELDDLNEKQLGVVDVAEYYAVKSPEFLVHVLPVGLLLALLYTLTSHARHNEITAIRAAGVSLWRVCVPYLVVGIIASVALFAVNEVWVPNIDDKAERILNRHTSRQKDTAERELVRNLGFTNTRDDRTWQIGAFHLRTAEMTAPQVDWRLPDGSRRWIFAERATRKNDVWHFFNVREYQDAADDPSMLVPSFQTNVMAFPEFSETPDEIRSEIKIGSRLHIRRARKADIPISEIFDYLRLHPNPSRTDAYWLYTKLHGRLAAPWTCLVVVLIAVPFGAPSGRRNVFVGVASSIFICFSYFILLQLGLALGAGGYVPAWLAAWSPNLTFGFAGLWLTARVR